MAYNNQYINMVFNMTYNTLKFYLPGEQIWLSWGK